MPGLMLLLLVKTCLLILPLTIFWLAFRRLLLSKSTNAWLYAASGTFALVTALGLLPWVLGVGTSHPIFFVFAAMTPSVWYGVVMLCNSARSVAYDNELERAFQRIAAASKKRTRPAPLILEEPQWPGTPMPVFRHQDTTETEPTTEKLDKAQNRASEATSALLSVARTMRGNDTSEQRRIKLLPPPGPSELRDMPFLKGATSA